MNIIKVKVNFEKRTNSITGVDLTSGDYNSTKMMFEFDREDGIKVFELKNPKGELVFSQEIENNEIVLTKIEEDGIFSSIFNMAGEYIFEVSLYANDGKLTSDYGYLPVEPEQVIIGDTITEPYLPIFDKLMQKINNAIIETNNLDITVIKENAVTTIDITKKDGTSESIQILDGKDYILTDEDKNEIVENTKPLVESSIQPTLENIENIANQAEVIAKGRATGYVFDTIEDLDLWLQDSENVSKLVLGDNLYIRTVGVPDYWWDGTSKQVLETEKPDLTDYAKKEQFVTLTQEEYDTLETKSANTYYFIPEEE